MKKIIAPVDFSANAENAAVFAANLAAFYGAELWLYHAYVTAVSVPGYAYPVVTSTEMQQAALDEMEEIAKRVQEKLRVQITIHKKADENFLQEGLSAFCDELQPDMVVMGLSGKGVLTRLVAGSNTIRAIRQLDYPVLVVPSKAEFIPVRRIGFACDLESIPDHTPLNALKNIVRGFNADFFVLNIQRRNAPMPADKQEAAFAVTKLLEELKPEYQTLVSEDITYAINWYAEEHKLDMMILMPKKHNLTDKLFGVSKTKDLVYHTHMPVLCIHG